MTVHYVHATINYLPHLTSFCVPVVSHKDTRVFPQYVPTCITTPHHHPTPHHCTTTHYTAFRPFACFSLLSLHSLPGRVRGGKIHTYTIAAGLDHGDILYVNVHSACRHIYAKLCEAGHYISMKAHTPHKQVHNHLLTQCYTCQSGSRGRVGYL